MALYKYSPLTGAREIRLLTLLPGDFHSEIEILLHNATLSEDSPPLFEAVSYVWGSTDNLLKVKVAADPPSYITVTKNLNTLLPYLRDKYEPRVLWIDAIAIDQMNTTERGHQVQLMRDIYGMAQRVVVWLGTEDSDSTYALTIMDQLNSKIDVSWLHATMKPSSSSADEQDWADRTKVLPYEARELDALYSLLHREWFERLWVRQEIRLANFDSIVMCGPTVITWQAFRNALFCLRHKSKRKEFLGTKAVPFHHRIEMVYQLSDDATSVPLGRHLRQTTHCKCSDPRDRVYAMLGLLQKSEREMNVQVDYSLTTGQVYENLVLRFIDHFKSLKIVASCEMQEKPPNMPTWVPDWSIGNIADPLWVPNADAQSVAVTKYLGNGILQASGVLKATLGTSDEVVFKSSSNPELVAGILRYVPPGDLGGPYIGGGTLLDAYCRTMCCDNFGEEYVPHLDHFPFLDKSKAILLSMIEAGDASGLDLTSGRDGAKYLDWVWSFCRGRSFFTTQEGYIGLAPKASKSGDKVCVLFGCPSPLILRQSTDKRYQLIGECYICGLMNGEALLGPIPQDYRPILQYDEVTKSHSRKFLDVQKGLVQAEDPRWKATSTENVVQHQDPSKDGGPTQWVLTPETVRKLEIDSREFELD
jgi:hypothetical protein